LPELEADIIDNLFLEELRWRDRLNLPPDVLYGRAVAIDLWNDARE
jgi:hypothetical protein